MTQEEFTSLSAMAAAGLAPIMLTTSGHVCPGRLQELAAAAVILAQQLSKEARTVYQTAGVAL